MRYRVILVPFPFDDLTGVKVRPAASLTDAVGAHRHVTLAFITSVVPPQLEPADLVLELTDPDFARTGLKVRSALRLYRMVTVSTSITGRARAQSPNSSSATPVRAFCAVKALRPTGGAVMQPFQGWEHPGTATQGSRYAPTLGWRMERRWR